MPTLTNLCHCGTRYPAGRRCPTCLAEYEQRRGSSYSRGYTRTWQRFRQNWRAALDITGDHEARLRAILVRSRCADPYRLHGRVVVPTQHVDHIKPHGGNPALMWDVANLQGLCRACHARKTREEQYSVRK